MRGSNLFTELFETEQPAPKKDKAGNPNNLERNEALISRYYYYGNFFEKKLSYNWIINTLAKEFWLSPVTVPQLIEDNFEMLIVLKKEKPALKFFKEKWPHIVWQA